MSEIPFDFRFFERFMIPLKRYGAGKHVFQAGEPGRHMFVVLDGSVKITREDKLLDTIGMHGIFGEMALIDEAPRSATATTIRGSEVAVIDRNGFLRLVGENPLFSLYVMKQMGARIRRMNESLRPNSDGAEDA